jgi:post-segregation antitoxin (ccd killing protein)
MQHLNAPKKATNLSINLDLLQKAKEYEAKQWHKNNQEAIEEYNQKIETRGVFTLKLPTLWAK